MTVASKSGSRDISPQFLVKKEHMKGYHARVHCYIEGHIHSYEYKDHKANKYRISHTFIADTIRFNETMTEKYFGLKGIFYETPACNIQLSGSVCNVIEDNQWLRILIKQENGNKLPDKVNLNMKKIDRQPVIKKGDYIYSVCSLSTPVRERDDRMVTFSDIVIRDIAKRTH